MRTYHRSYWMLLLPLLLCVSCEDIKEAFGDDDDKFEARDLKFFGQWQGTQSGVELPAQRVIKNQQDWTALWQQIHSGQSGSPDAPRIDFEKRMVLAALMGRQSTGGHSIQITRVRERENDVRARYRQISPTGSGAPGQTSPYHLVEVRRVKGKPVEWVAE